VMVQPQAGSKLLLEDFVSGQLTKVAADGLVVPRDAVLPGEGTDFELFTVRDGKAVKHTVRVGVENDQEAQVMAEGLKAGDPAVVIGNFELEDGMAVRAQDAPATTRPAEVPPPPTQPAETRPSTTTPVATGGAS